MSEILRKYMKGDATLWTVFFVLCVISAVEMYSASSTLAYKASSYAAPMLRHVFFLGFGIIIAFVAHLVPYKYIRMLSYVGLVLSVLMLVFVLFKGKSANDATRWLEIGGFQFQPSELAKLSLIGVVADLIARIKAAPEREPQLFWSVLGIAGLISFLILLENFSTAALLFGVVLIMMFIGRVSGKKLVFLVVVLVSGVVLGLGAFKVIPKETMPDFLERGYTWVARIDRFADEETYEQKYSITDDNLQEQHGKIAIARGGFFGLMPGNSVQRDFLPQAYSDFIYAIIVEELGMFGGVFVIVLFMILLYRAGRIATMSRTVFPAILVMGLTLMIVFQAFVSMAVSTGLGPVTGQPMPLISRGGTSILITSIYFGIIFGVTRQIKEERMLIASEPAPPAKPVIEEEDEEVEEL